MVGVGQGWAFSLPQLLLKGQKKKRFKKLPRLIRA